MAKLYTVDSDLGEVASLSLEPSFLLLLGTAAEPLHVLAQAFLGGRDLLDTRL